MSQPPLPPPPPPPPPPTAAHPYHGNIPLPPTAHPHHDNASPPQHNKQYPHANGQPFISVNTGRTRTPQREDPNDTTKYWDYFGIGLALCFFFSLIGFIPLAFIERRRQRKFYIMGGITGFCMSLIIYIVIIVLVAVFANRIVSIGIQQQGLLPTPTANVPVVFP